VFGEVVNMFVLLRLDISLMNNHKKADKKNNSIQSSGIWGLGLVAFLSFFLIGGPFIQAANALRIEKVVQENSHSLSSSQFVSKTLPPFQFPIEPPLMVEELEFSDGNEDGNEFKKHSDNHLHQYYLKLSLLSQSEAGIVLHSIENGYSKSTVSLFVLFHSWKSFLI
jgi:hypothetical protein